MPPRSTATVAPARRLSGRVRVPGDKSISHRYALLGALADGRSAITNFAPGADCRSTLACLRQLGVEIVEDTPGIVTLVGRGSARLSSPAAPLDCGNSGTTMRLLAGILAGQAFSSEMIGDGSLSRRPMSRIIAPLEEMGGRIDAAGGHAPLRIQGAELHAITYRCPLPSAQVKSAVLLAGLHPEGTTRVVEPAQTRDHTERAFAAFGATVRVNGLTVAIDGRQCLVGRPLAVPGDFSSAAFWMVGAAALPGSRVEIDDVGLNPTRIALVEVLRRFGARVIVESAPGDAGEPRGTIVVEGDRRNAIDIAPDEVPALIDELPAIAALAAHGGEVAVRGAAELRVKESDRIAALVAGLRALGVDADERPDGFLVRGPSSSRRRPSGGIADARGDHRLAMAFAIAALGAERPSTVEGADVVVVSYPGFFETLDRLAAPHGGLAASEHVDA